LVLVGLPATGKTYLSHKLSRFLRWLGVKAAPFTLAMYREKMFGKQKHTFFDPANKDALERRKVLMEHALADMISYLDSGGQVAIFDGTNVTQLQRRNIFDKLTSKNIQVCSLWRMTSLSLSSPGLNPPLPSCAFCIRCRLSLLS